MRKLILKMSVTVDGFVGGPNGEIGYIFKSADDVSLAWTIDMISRVGLHFMGSKTFHDMASWWPTSTEAVAPPMNNIPKGVFTRKGFTGPDRSKLTAAVRDAQKNREATGEVTTTASAAVLDSWLHPRIFDGDLADEIQKLKQESGGDILAHGGAGFAQSLVATGLIDEYLLLVHPVVLGSGLPLFSSLAKPMDLELVEIQVFPRGAAAHVYRPAHY